MSKPTCKDPELSGNKEDFEDLEQQLPRQAPGIGIIIIGVVIIISIMIIIGVMIIIKC